MLRAAQHVVRVAGPDADLVAVRVLDDADLVLRRDDRDPRGLVVRTNEMRTVGAGGEADDVPRVERALALRRSQRRRAGEDESMPAAKQARRRLIRAIPALTSFA